MATVRVRYQTIEVDDLDIHLRTLRDLQQFADDNGEAERLGISSAVWPRFGVLWDASQVLANHMRHYPVDGLRILEMGCGMALASLVLKLRGADITATDIHPEVAAYLAANAALNGCAPPAFVRTGWGDASTDLGCFDLLIGSDLLYEREHVAWLSDFICAHAAPRCAVVLVDPGRGHHAAFSRNLVDHGFVHSQHRPPSTDYLASQFPGQILEYSRAPAAN